MSHIDDLIDDLCPDGVEFEPLAAIGDWYGGGTPSKSNASFWTGGTIPWVSPKDMGRYVVDSAEDLITVAAISGSSTKLVPPTSVVMVVRSSILDKRFPTALVPVEVALNQDMKAVVPRDEILPGYLAHLLRASGPDILRAARKTGGSVASIDSGKLFAYRIPVPPLGVQREIVRVLDQFIALEAELEAELEARRRQYQHYRDLLIHSVSPSSGQRRELGQVGRVVTGRTPAATNVGAWGDYVDFVTPSDIKNGMREISLPSRRLSERGAEQLANALVSPQSLLVTCIGADMGKSVINRNTCVSNQQINAIIPNSDVNVGYLFHHMTSLRDSLRKQGQRAGGTMPIVNKADFSKIVISIPKLAEQRRIADILDNFDALVNDLSVGLPAELAARRKQYEYYRDQLLMFKEKVA